MASPPTLSRPAEVLSPNRNSIIIVYANDTTIIDLIKGRNKSADRGLVSKVNEENNDLGIKIGKT